VDVRWKAWGFVGVQLGLIAGVLLLPRGDVWALPVTATRAAQVLSWIGLGIVGAGLLNLGASVSPLPLPVAGGALRIGGLFRFVRHPIYSGVIVWAVASAAGSGSIVVAACGVALVAWLSVKARWEEKRLAAHYPGYTEYAARTPRFVPLWRTR